MMSEFNKCSVCNQWGFFDGHRCPPVWEVRYADDVAQPEWDYEPEWTQIRADSARDAAVKFSRRDSGDHYDGFEDAVVVRSPLADDETPQAFTVSVELVPSYDAVPVAMWV